VETDEEPPGVVNDDSSDNSDNSGCSYQASAEGYGWGAIIGAATLVVAVRLRTRRRDTRMDISG